MAIKRDAAHLKWIRQQPCCVPGCEWRGIIHAHHIRTAANSGTGMKPPDRDTVPMCGPHHRHGHLVGWRTFEARSRIDLAALAKDYAALSGTEMP